MEVRKPYNSIYYELKQLYENNYKDIRQAKNELSQLIGFSNIFLTPLLGKAFKETQSLIKELCFKSK